MNNAFLVGCGFSFFNSLKPTAIILFVVKILSIVFIN